MSKKKPEQRELSVRDQIGLTSASDGDTNGVHIFVRFVERELSSLGFFGGLPEPVALRLQCLAREAERVGHFVEGWNAGTKDKS